jgi:hypothetical protein
MMQILIAVGRNFLGYTEGGTLVTACAAHLC